MSVIVGQPQRMMIYWQWFIGQAGICLFCVCLFGYRNGIANLFLVNGRKDSRVNKDLSMVKELWVGLILEGLLYE